MVFGADWLSRRVETLCEEVPAEFVRFRELQGKGTHIWTKEGRIAMRPHRPFFVTRCPTLFPIVASFFVKMLSKGAADSSGSSRTVKKRVALGRKCLEYIAGSTEDAKLLAKHVAGFDNWTTDEILGRFKALPGKECTTKQVKKSGDVFTFEFPTG